MTPQTKRRRTALIDQIITDKALDYRFDHSGHPHTTDTLKEGADYVVTVFNETADRIDKWAKSAGRKSDLVGLRLELSALAIQLRLADGSMVAGPELVSACWRSLGNLDRVVDYLTTHSPTPAADKKPTKLTVPIELVQWMADYVFLVLLGPELFERAAHQKGHIWDRRLRHTKRAKARKGQAFMHEAELVLEDARQEAEFVSFLRDVLRKDRKMRRDVRSDRNYADFDFSTAPPDVRVVRLADRKGFMLTPPTHGRPKRAPTYPETK